MGLVPSLLHAPLGYSPHAGTGGPLVVQQPSTYLPTFKIPHQLPYDQPLISHCSHPAARRLQTHIPMARIKQPARVVKPTDIIGLTRCRVPCHRSPDGNPVRVRANIEFGSTSQSLRSAPGYEYFQAARGVATQFEDVRRFPSLKRTVCTG